MSTKMFVGGLRPYFLETCVPSFNCDLVNGTTYVWPHEYECTNTVAGIDYDGTNLFTIDLFRSFFSGHALLASLSMIYLIVSQL